MIRKNSNKQTYDVAIIGATGTIGQRYISLLEGHPWFRITVVAAAPNLAGQTYAQAVKNSWYMETPIPKSITESVLLSGSAIREIAEQVDLVFCAVDMPNEKIVEMEEAFARFETPVISNNAATRWYPDVPLVIPELNHDHFKAIESQKKRLGTRSGFIVTNPNCTVPCFIPPLYVLREYGLKRIQVSTYQSISGAGKTFDSWPEIIDNIIPYIKDEEEKTEKEALKVLGNFNADRIEPASTPIISAQCVRIPTENGHLVTVSVEFEKKPDMDSIINLWNSFKGRPQHLELPSAPFPFMKYFEEVDRPQLKLDRELSNRMGISLGRLRSDPILDYKFICLNYNVIRGAAGSGILTAEMLVADGYIQKK